MTQQEHKDILRVLGKDYDEIDRPTYIREREEKEEIADDHIKGEVMEIEEGLLKKYL